MSTQPQAEKGLLSEELFGLWLSTYLTLRLPSLLLHAFYFGLRDAPYGSRGASDSMLASEACISCIAVGEVPWLREKQDCCL